MTTRRTVLKAGASATLAATALTVSGTSTLWATPASATSASEYHPDPVLQAALDEVVAAGASGALAEVRRPAAWRGVSGVAQLDSARPVPVNGRFRIGSVTKTFVATVVLQLVGERRLRLDDPLDRWLPGIVPNSDRITIRNLLQHTSGVYNYTNALFRLFPTTEDLLRQRYRTFRPAELVALAAAEQPLFEPGTSWSYSNTDYILLGLVIEKITGRLYGDQITRRILRPLDLRHTDLPGTNPRIAGPHAHGYMRVERDGQTELVDVTTWSQSSAWAAGEIISTAADVNRFLSALLGGRLLSRALLTEMLDTTSGLGEHGLGLRRAQAPCGTAIWGHTGGFFGYETWAFATEDGQSAATLSYNPLPGPEGPLPLLFAAAAFVDTAFCGTPTPMTASPSLAAPTEIAWLH